MHDENLIIKSAGKPVAHNFFFAPSLSLTAFILSVYDISGGVEFIN